jgi:anti-sigma B factor antagonist
MITLTNRFGHKGWRLGTERRAMHMTIEKTPDVAVLAVTGDSLAANNVAVFKRELETLTQTTNRVVVDLSEVQFIDSSGCGALLQFHKRLQDKGGALGVCCVSAPVRALFELVRIQRVLDIFPDRKQAVAALGD